MSNKSHTESISRVFDLLPFINQKYNRQIAFGFRRNGEWKTISTKEYILSSELLSYALLESGIGKGDNIVTITPNRPEFNIVDMGLLQVGAVHVPLYTGLTDSKLFDILLETKCRIIFVAGNTTYRKIQSLRDRLPGLEHIITFDRVDGATFFEDFLEQRKNLANPALLEKIKSDVQPTDPASIIYISGASTPINGVVLTHRNHVSNFLNYSELSHLEGNTTAVSLLPLSHSYERMINYSQQYFGLSIYYNEKIPGMFRDFSEVKPETVVMVPLLIQRMFATFEQNSIQSSPSLRRLISGAIKAAKRKVPGKPSSLPDWFAIRLAGWFVFPGWRKALGGRIRVILCGGAALNPELLNLSLAAGITIYEGYGLTEAGPLVSYNINTGFRKYTVGKPMPGVEIKIAPDGEVLVKSPSIMPGYYKKEEESRKVIDEEGWLHTGDLGKMDSEGFLTLTGVKKEIFKLSSGLYVSPAVIEEKLKQSPLIRQAWVYGHNREYLAAILIPDFDEIAVQFSGLAGMADPGKLPIIDSIIPELEGEIKKYNNQGRGPDQIVKFALVADEWTLENGLLNESGDLNRQKLLQFYHDRIVSLY